MPNGKLTKAGGRDYGTVEGAQSRAPNSYEHICDTQMYMGTGMPCAGTVPPVHPPIKGGSNGGFEMNEYPVQVPEDPRWACYNGNTHLANHPKPTEPGDARFPPIKGDY